MSNTRTTGLVPTPAEPASSGILSVISWIFGLAALSAGLINCFYGNDSYFGIFIVLLSISFFPPVIHLVHKYLGIRVPSPIMFLLALFIIWVTLGVGELFYKIDLMLGNIC
ncbi:MAG: hypothetical protein EOO09_00255 [Chitinophagaceae bacterium]|nr:MAG: hypothetical protein EOO09_00255 [Chitinophagaceae bacterium]